MLYVPIGRLDQVMELVSGTTSSWTLVDRSYLAAVLSLLQQCLPLARPAKGIARLTVFSGLSGANGDELGTKNRDILAKRMSPTAIETAQRLARECIAKNYKNC